MVRTADVGKRMTWRKRLRRFDKWTGAVAQFCAEERVSVASFYQWRRKLKNNRVGKPDSPRAQDGDSRRDAGGRGGRKPPVKNAIRTDAKFVPVQVVGSAVVEVFLTGGPRLSIPADATDALSTVVRALSAKPTAASQVSGGRIC